MARKKTIPRKGTGRKATPAQLRNLAKGRAKLKAMRRAKKKSPIRRVRKKAARRKVAKRKAKRRNYPKARAALLGKNPVKPSSRVKPHYAIKANGRYFDGSGFTATRAKAAEWKDIKVCEKVAQGIADKTGKACSIVD